MNFEVWHSWVSQLSGVLGKLIHLLEHISSARMGLLQPLQNFVLLLRKSWRFTTKVLSAIFLPASQGPFHICGSVLTTWGTVEIRRTQPYVVSVCPAGWLHCGLPAGSLVWLGWLYQVALWLIPHAKTFNGNIEMSLFKSTWKLLSLCTHAVSSDKSCKISGIFTAFFIAYFLFRWSKIHCRWIFRGATRY